MKDNRYTKRPVTIEAIVWDGSNINEIMDFMNWRNADHDDKNGLIIRTLEGQHKASVGDYIIKGVKGEFYPCKPDIFKLTYYKSGKLDGLVSMEQQNEK